MSNCYAFPLPLMNHLSLPERCRFRHTLVITAAVRRHHRRRLLLKYSPNPAPTTIPTFFKLSDGTLQITLKSPSNSLQHLQTKLNKFIDYSREAFDDLRTVVTIDGDNGGVVVSCKRSSIEFLVAILVSSLIVIISFRGLFNFGKNRDEVLLYKRDRSLGGKEVVVGKRETIRSATSRNNLTPLSSDTSNDYYPREINRNRNKNRTKKELPHWWPHLANLGPLDTTNKEEYQRMVNLLIRAIMDSKMSGKDISINDIVQLRHICKTYGVRAMINTENTRNSLYRASINFVLSYCESVSNGSTSVEINGEDAREFIAGLADNIGLESARAARMVSAAVAARTRSKILQAWALEVQNKHSEALVELFKVCLIHRIFPPEESSPEMEMVARGLEKSLNAEQREHILNSFLTVCGEDIDQSVVEALGLGVEDEQGNKHVQIQ